ncbi:MAG: phage recombination protein Bet [Phycisphaerales bacterium]|nr:phage recombination protein Bet [Chloroflexota bacterium]
MKSITTTKEGEHHTMSTEKIEQAIQPVASIARIERTHVTPWQQLEFTKERLDIMRRTITPPTASEAEFGFFVEWCRQTGLNPFLKQAYLVERWDSNSNTKKHDPMVAEAGFAARADALPDFRGMRSGVVYAGDEFFIDESTQEIVHRWSVEARAKSGNKVIGAWAHGRREGREVEITWLTVESRIQKKRDGSANIFWARDPGGQIRKCARADQYRRLYPNIFAGWYDPAEMQTEVEVNPAPALQAPTVQQPAAKTRALAQRLGVTPVDPGAPTSKAPDSDADRGKNKASTEAPKAEPQQEEPPPFMPDDEPAQPKPPKTPPTPASTVPPLTHLRFGASKGTALEDCSTIELEEALQTAEANVAKAKGKEPWLAPVREGIAAVKSEIAKREATLDAPEPGSEG